jgi:hypothetical protein
MPDASTPAAGDEATWFKVLLAVRWPVAVVASAGVLGGVLLHVLSRPIPIRLAMPLDQPLAVTAQVAELARPIKVDQLDSEIEIDLDETITVRGSVALDTPRPIPISGEPRVVVSGPVEVKAGSALPVQGSVDVTAAEPLPVEGAVDVTAGRPLPVKAEVDVATPEPLQVDADVKLDTYDQPVNIEVKGGLMGIF